MKIGITGHQDLGDEQNRAWVETTLEKQINNYGVTHGITSLAIGADQLYAEILERKHIPFTAVLPSDKYEETFDEEGLKKYEDLLSKAEGVIKMNFDAPNEKAYLEAGKEVVNLSNVMFAVWNGEKAKGLGGTGDIVEYCKQLRKKVVHINPITHEIIEK